MPKVSSKDVGLERGAILSPVRGVEEPLKVISLKFELIDPSGSWLLPPEKFITQST